MGYDKQREERRHRGDEKIQVVHVGSECGRLFGEKRVTYDDRPKMIRRLIAPTVDSSPTARRSFTSVFALQLKI